MNSAIRSVLLCSILLLPGHALAQGTWADEDVEILEASGTRVEPDRNIDEEAITYSGIGVSFISADFRNVKDAVTLDITLIGFRIPNVNWFGIELNAGFTVIPGQITRTQPGDPGSPTGCGFLNLEPCPGTPGTSAQGDFNANHASLNAVLRMPTTFYLMGKVGYRYVGTNLPELDDDRSGSATGFGIGYRFSKYGFVELHHTRLSDRLELTGLQVSTHLGRR
jgi:hypothetical protein